MNDEQIITTMGRGQYKAHKARVRRANRDWMGNMAEFHRTQNLRKRTGRLFR